VLVEYLQLWNMVDGVNLQPDTTDQHIWHLSSHGIYSSKSAYEAFLTRSITFGPWRVWTFDRLAKRGLPHPATCPLCDQVEVTIQHILVSCIFARQVWSLILSKLSLLAIAPQPGCTRFSNWWCRKEGNVWCLAVASALQDLFLVRLPMGV
ncbi:hypothetical protein U9M48_036903, partial [Paspalum notatum var. saurae]